MTKSKISLKHAGFDMRWYEILLDISPVGVFFTDAEGNCLHVNQRWCDIAGISSEQALGKGWIQAIYEEDLESVVSLWYESAQNHRPFHAEYRFCTPEGRITWVVGDAMAKLTSDGTVEGYIGTITDINLTKTYLVELEQVSERISTIISQMPVILFAFNKKGYLCAWNHEAERVSGYTAEEMINNPKAMELLCPDVKYRQKMLEMLKKKRNVYLDWEWQLTAKDSSIKIISLSNIAKYHPLKDWANWGIGIDVTERRKTEHNLRERVKELTCLYKLSQISNRPNLELNKFFQDVIELIPPSWQYPENTCARIIYQGQIFKTDPFAVTRWQLGSDLYVRGRKVGSIEVYFLGNQTLSGETPFLNEERLLIDEIALQVSRTIGHVLTKQDLALIEELSARAEELEQFSHVISHDLRTPLTAIGGYAEFLHKQITQNNFSQAKSCAQQITIISERMAQRLEEILKLAKLGKIVRPAEAVDLKDVFNETLTMLAPRLEKNEITVKLADQFPLVVGDRIRLNEVVENLLDNAIKYIGKKPNRIEIGCRFEKNAPIFFVKDNGVGIHSKYFDSIFDLFWRIDKKGEGDGTGLAIAKRIIEAHGGKLWVESKGLGEGACFCFTLGRVLNQ